MQVSAATSTSTVPAAAPSISPGAQVHAADAATNRRLAGAVRKLNETGAAGTGREFSFSIDPQTKRGVVRIVNSESRELIEQVPSEYILQVEQELDQQFASKAGRSGR
jgi:flagellar protein FlaG